MPKSLSCGAFKLAIPDRLEARPTRVLLIVDTKFKCRTAYLYMSQLKTFYFFMQQAQKPILDNGTVGVRSRRPISFNFCDSVAERKAL
ncbi:hypothetical protein QUA82_07850 [Microcoleus sp. F8-D3]